MPINSLEFAKKFTSELDKMFVQKSVTGFMVDNVFKAKFVGTNEVIIPDLDMTGLGDYDRDNGYPTNGSLRVNHTSYTLTMDRAQRFLLDVVDADETGIANLIGLAGSEFMCTKVIPEVDSYVLSKLYGIANTQRHTTTVAGTGATYKQLVDSFNNVWDRAGFDAELVCFVDRATWSGLMTSNEISRHIVVSDFKQGEVNLKVKKLNDVTLIPVASSRMKSAYNKTNNGLVPTEDALGVPYIVLPKNGASLVRKHVSDKFIPPSNSEQFDAYQYFYRLFYDALVKKSKVDYIEAGIYEAPVNNEQENAEEVDG